MTRPLEVIPAEPHRVAAALEAALSGSGPAILPHPDPSSAVDVPELVPQKVAVVVETSGSTGRPKRVAISPDALLANAAASEVALGGPGQWMLALPAHYIAGIAVLVRALAAQIAPVFLDPSGFTAERFVAAAGELDHPRRFVSLVPVQLSRLLDTDDAVHALRGFERVLVGGQSMPSALAARADELGVSITRTYGSSETSGGCVYDGVAIGDTRVRISDGRVELAGSMLAEGYLGDPERTELAFRDEHGDRWFRTDDTGEVVDGVLTITGRADDVIVSGGVKVSLAAVEAVVRGMPGLEQAVVVAAPHPVWGESPVVVSELAVTREEVRSVVAEQLGAAAAPTEVVIVDRVPLLPSGKPDRLTVAALVSGSRGDA
ncbi:O-succinylbenzoic acid--CoA ligase [Microbacteriaceae bacterium SG_E_30_P1]|uniref:O-succinylbenzoic acid--CoA ligase n=1 Tax=Antiquaquibacter oligotrophicus TaxID=2880260 RepID=A0ABT6KQF2_9MICO|nr:AMP-binding protein [Antiquaquibacter oligotrophicus]MDH6182020.1 O-succinylbenzoic acid--CoA ligase [Antiquaquibacter oligotrophicus]UDF12312.1 AMP-binding protein [Antiquaquibacter oligotrophicus]